MDSKRKGSDEDDTAAAVGADAQAPLPSGGEDALAVVPTKRARTELVPAESSEAGSGAPTRAIVPAVSSGGGGGGDKE